METGVIEKEMTIEEFKSAVLSGIPDQLPNPKPFDYNLNLHGLHCLSFR